MHFAHQNFLWKVQINLFSIRILPEITKQKCQECEENVRNCQDVQDLRLLTRPKLLNL